MFPSIRPPMSILFRRFVLVALSTCGTLRPVPALATDYNIDYSATSACGVDHGGVVLVIDAATPSGTGGIGGTPYYINSPFRDYSVTHATCTTEGVTLVSWACNGSTTSPCIADGDVVHVGVSVAEPDIFVRSAFLYTNVATGVPCSFTTNPAAATACDLSSYDPICFLAPAEGALQREVAEGIRYTPLSLTAYHVHTDGKSLTIVGGVGWPSDVCERPVYVGGLSLEYYSERQLLSTLNANSQRSPIETGSLGEGTVEIVCGDTITVGRFADPPADAKYVVLVATQDTVATLDSPGASRLWIQETIVRPGQHVIVASADANGAISPEGAVAVDPNGSQSFDIVPHSGYRVSDVLVDGVSIGAAESYTFANITEDHTIAASFEIANVAPDCSRVTAEPGVLWPPNHKLVDVRVTGVTDPDGDPVDVRVTRVTLDESVEGQEHEPSAVLDGGAGCRLRAERLGSGNGRVYTLWFTADDGRGGECTGSVQVCVPHDRAHAGCVDDGQEFDAVGPGPEPRQERSHAASKLEVTRLEVAGTRATVEYFVPGPGQVRLALFDVAGRRVRTIEDAYMEGGIHEAVWNTDGLNGGVYFYQLRSGGDVVVRAVVIR